MTYAKSVCFEGKTIRIIEELMEERQENNFSKAVNSLIQRAVYLQHKVNQLRELRMDEIEVVKDGNDNSSNNK